MTAMAALPGCAEQLAVEEFGQLVGDLLQEVARLRCKLAAMAMARGDASVVSRPRVSVAFALESVVKLAADGTSTD